MFGNRAGWLISLVIVIVTGLLLYTLQKKATEASGVTGVGQNASRYSLKLESPNPRALATWMKDDADAVEIYRQAVKHVEVNRRAYNAYIDRGTLDSEDFSTIEPGLRLLIQASTKARPGVFSDRLQEVISYDTDRLELKEGIAVLRQAAIKVGRQYQNSTKDSGKAKDLYQALFSLGVKLMEERLVYDEWFEGRQALAVSKWLGELSPESALRYRQLDEEIQAIYKPNIEPVQQTVMVTRPYTGDMIALAQNAGDRMWRIEAILALGRCRFSGETPGDRFAADRVCKELAQDKDPAIKLAATLARDLTDVQFRKLR